MLQKRKLILYGEINSIVNGIYGFSFLSINANGKKRLVHTVYLDYIA